MCWTHMELLVKAVLSVLFEKLHLHDDTPNPYPKISQIIAVCYMGF